MGRGKGQRAAAAANPTAQLERAAERQHVQLVNRHADEIEDEVEELKETWDLFEEERQRERAAGRLGMGDTCMGLLEQTARLIGSCANRFLAVVALGARGPAGADDYEVVAQIHPASYTGYVVDTAEELGHAAFNMTWLPLQLRYRMLCASATACLELGPALVTAWMRRTIRNNEELVPALTANVDSERHCAAAWGVQALRHAVLMLTRLAELVDADGSQRGTLGSLLRATCAADAKLLPALNFLGAAANLCTARFYLSPANLEVPEQLGQVLRALNGALWPDDSLPDAFLPALLGRHPRHAADLLRLTAAAMKRSALQLEQVRVAAVQDSGSLRAEQYDAEGVRMLADNLELAVSVLCAPALDSTWQLVGRKLPLTGRQPQLPSEEQFWVLVSEAVQSSISGALNSCGAAVGLSFPDLYGGIASPESLALHLAFLLSQLLKGGSSGSSGSSGGSGGSRQGEAGGRQGGRGRAAEAAAPSLSDSERSEWAMRLTTMVSDALHLCVRIGWPVRGSKPAGGSSNADSSSGSGSGGAGASTVAGAASGSTAAPPVAPEFVQQQLQLVVAALSSHYRSAMAQEDCFKSVLSALDSSDDAEQRQEGGACSNGSGSQGSSDKEEGSEEGSHGEDEGSSAVQQQEGGGAQKQQEEEEDGERSPRRQALWTLRVLLEAIALRLPAAGVAASADSLAAVMCQLIEAAARASAAMHLAFADAMRQPVAEAGPVQAAEEPIEAPAEAGSAQAACAAAAAGSAEQPDTAQAASQAAGEDDSTDPDQGTLGDLDLAGCARALTWLMAALLESGEGASLTVQQHSAALRPLLLLLRTAAKHALAAAKAVVDTPTNVTSGADFDATMASWLHNAAQLLAMAACAVVLRARVWQQAGGVDEISQQRLAGGVLAALAAADELADALQHLGSSSGGTAGYSSSDGGTSDTSGGEAAAGVPTLAAETAAGSAVASEVAAGTAAADPPPFRPGTDEPLAPTLALATARSWALAACPAVLQLPQGRAALGALAAALSNLPADSCKAPVLLASCLQGLLEVGQDAQHGPSQLRELCRLRAFSGVLVAFNRCFQHFSQPAPATLLLPPLMEALAGCLGGLPFITSRPSDGSLNQQLGLERLHPHAPWRLTALLQGTGPVRQWAASPGSWNVYWRTRYARITELELEYGEAAEASGAAGSTGSGAAEMSAGNQQQQQLAGQQQQLAAARALGRLRCSHLGCCNVHGASEAGVPSLKCSACRVLRFCSNECSQKAWWPEHRPVCKLLQAEAQQASAAAAEVAP